MPTRTPRSLVRRLGAVALVSALAACAGGRPVGEAPGTGSTVAITHVGVADGTTPEPRRDWTVVVRDGRIAAAGPADAVRVPAGATVIDGSGRYLVPGLWDMHVHLNDRDAEWLPLLVAHGVTSVRDVGAFRAAEADSVRRQVIARGLPAPRIATAGFVVETPGSLAFMERLATGAAATRHPTPRWNRGRLAITTPAEAEAVADSVVRAGGTMLKFIDPGSAENFRALAGAARARDLLLVGHAPQTLRVASPWQALDAGVRSFEHMWGFARVLDTMAVPSRAALAARMRERDAAYVPTLIVSGQDAIPTDRFRALVDDSLGAVDPRNRWISAHEWTQWDVRLRTLRAQERSAEWIASFQRGYDREAAALRELHRLGAPVLPGSDLGMYLVYPGASLHDELALLTRDAGMTPFEALRSATLASARWMGMADSVGSIRPGQVADLVLLDADPLASVANLARVRGVMVRGRVYDRAALDAILAWRAR
jgi:imidazolonepropionase-like amidohydrolase